MEERKRCQWCGGPLHGRKERWCSFDCATNGNLEAQRYRKALASPAGRDGYYKTSLRIIKRRIPMRLSSSLASQQWENLANLYDDFTGGTEEEVKLHDLIGRVLDAPGKEPLSKELRKEIEKTVHNKTISKRNPKVSVQVKVVTEPWESKMSLVEDPSMECKREGFRALVKVRIKVGAKAKAKSVYYQVDLRRAPDAESEVEIWKTDTSDMRRIGDVKTFPCPSKEGISKERLLKFINNFSWVYFVQQAEESIEGTKNEDMQELQ